MMINLLTWGFRPMLYFFTEYYNLIIRPQYEEP